MLHNLWTDIRQALRQITRAPGIALAVVGTIALTIGASSALFSLYNALVLRSLPVADPSRIVLVQPIDESGRNRPLYLDTYRELAKLPVFEHLGLYSGGGMFLNEARGVRAESLIEAVTPGFFEALGLQPHLGRFFIERDFADTEAPVTVLSHTMWMRLFDGDPAAIGEIVAIDAKPMTVIGVTPPSFKGFYVDGGFGFSVPITLLNRYLGSDAKRPVRGLQAVGRLKDSTSVAQANAAVAAAWQSLRSDAVPPQLPPAERQDIAKSGIKVETLAAGFSNLRTRFQRPLTLLLAATVVLLVIGCVNLSGLLLARTAARDQQFAILLALGAPRARFAQQVVTEGVVLSLIGTAIAVPFAWWTTSVLTNTIWTSRDPIAISTAPDGRVLLTMIVAAVLMGVVMAALPAARAARQRNLGLRAERAVSQSLGPWGRGLLVAQIALSLVLVVGAGLFARSLWNLRNIDGGFSRDDVRWTRLFAMPGAPRPKDLNAHHTALLQTIEQLPEIKSASMNQLFPTMFNAPQFLTRHSVSRVEGGSGDAAVNDALLELASPRFFETTGIDWQQGRDFSWTDVAGAPPVAILSGGLSRRLFGNTNPVGQRIKIGNDARRASVEVIGVAGDASIGDLRDPNVAVVYMPRFQESIAAPILLFRPAGDVASAEAAIRSVLATGGYDYARGWFAIEQNVDATLMQERVLAALSGFLAAVALLLAFVGVHGLLAFAVTQRRRELGIRLALGATPALLRRMVVREGLLVAVAGVVIGLALASGITNVAASMLFGVAPTDPLVISGAAMFFIAVGICAGLRPANRAASLDPVETLRAE